MECKDIKNLIPDFLSGNLGSQVIQEVLDHIAQCPDCNKELSAYKKSWELLGSWQDVEPERGYVSRFWTRLAMRKPWHEKVLERIAGLLTARNLYPAFASACIIFIVVFFAVKVIWQAQISALPLSYLSSEEIEFVENMELAQDLEIIEDIEFFENLDVIEQMEGLDV